MLCERQGLAAAYAFLLRAPKAKSLLLLLYAVEPEMRGSGVGSDFLRTLLERASGAAGLYAEVEKEELAPDAAERRTRARSIAFYERLGFHYNGYYYIHPSYQKGCTPHQLLILSWPKPITEEEYRTFIRDMWEIVMLYSQNSASVGECRTPLSEKVYPYSKNS